MKLLAFILLFGGIVLDHASTRYALGQLGTYETNPYQVLAMSLGFYGSAELLILLSTIILLRHTSNLPLILFPVLLGSLLLLTGIHNILLF